jgi:hypothetical protein
VGDLSGIMLSSSDQDDIVSSIFAHNTNEIVLEIV